MAAKALSFKENQTIVYPTHGVGLISAIEVEEIAGLELKLYVIQFDKEKMTLRVPVAKAKTVGMRALSEAPMFEKALKTLKGKPRVKRTMWSRRAQEYEAKINSGDIIQVSEVVRDLYRSESQPEQSYSERQLYEAALERLSREIGAIKELDDVAAIDFVIDILSKGAKSRAKDDEAVEEKGDTAAA